MSAAPPAPRAAALRPQGTYQLSAGRPVPVIELPELLTLVLLVLLGLALNHSSVILGLNLSLADPVVAVLIIVLLVRGRLWIPVGALVFFLLLSVQLLAVTTLLVPTWTSVPLPVAGTGQEYAKLVVSFLCFLLGVQVVRLGRAELLLRAFVAGAVVVSAIGALSIVVPALHGAGTLFLGGFRFQGLTNDPNNFAVLSVAALAALWYDRGARPPLRIAASTLLIIGILLSASKTGAIALLLLVIWRGFGLRSPHGEEESSRGRHLLAVTCVLALSALVLLIAPATGVGGTLSELVARFPALERTSTLLTSFDTAIAGSGSERESAWATALSLIWFSPILGVGVGTYLDVAVEITGVPVLAHNTYLQVMAEWGLPLALVFLVWTARVTMRRPENPALRPLWAAASTALLVMLVGSMGLSLNNSRLLWILLGMTAAAHLLSTTRRGGPS
ncbi:O-antigen ligase [Brachybacterium sp. YJGR34]|uniref:O-antigen ligase family protein n=1 Tax=Brachybacterium sp. YJGR34 TaxID=2059911 RepID=UPI000E0ABFDB|nr:O-antigen ligase family protein [Brachybacterium sp. YJGR34]